MRYTAFTSPSAQTAHALKRSLSKWGKPTTATTSFVSAAICPQRLGGGADEARSQQQVLRRVAGHRELGKERELGAGAARLLEPREDGGAVAVEVADDGVDLGEREPHGLRLTV